MKKKYFLDNSRNIKMLLKFFYASLILLVAIDFFIPRHPYFPWERYPSFYAAYGFVACVLLVLVAKYIFRKIVMRREDYYDA